MPDRVPKFNPPDFPPPVELPYLWRERDTPIELYAGELELI